MVGVTGITSVIERLDTNDRRNLLILSRVMDEADWGGKLLLFACSVEHANVLANLAAHGVFIALSAGAMLTQRDGYHRLLAPLTLLIFLVYIAALFGRLA